MGFTLFVFAEHAKCFLMTCFFSYFNDYRVAPLLINFVQNIHDAATNETAFESRWPRLLSEVEGVAEN